MGNPCSPAGEEWEKEHAATWDIWLFVSLQLAKVLHYMKWKRVCEAVFIVFAVVFISSRLVIFPLM